MISKRAAFVSRMRRLDPARLVFVDESGANLAMSRSHAWVRRGQEHVEPRPMNWGANMTMIGALRLSGWCALGTILGAANRYKFRQWFRRCLRPKLQRGDIVVLDNAQAHKGSEIQALVQSAGASLLYLPPYSPDLNPIEPAWAIVKKYIKAIAPRSVLRLRQTAHNASRRVRPRHCSGWFTRSGYLAAS